MKTKKFLSLLLALAMIFSLSVSVFATGGSTSGSGSSSSNANEFNVTATVTIPTISVTVPSSTNAKLFINPMGFKVKTSDGKAAGLNDTDMTDSQIVSVVHTIKNSSPMDLDVRVSGIATPDASNKALSVSATQISATDTKNNVFIYVNFGVPGGTDAAPTLAAQDYDATNASTVALTTKASDPVKVGTIAKATDSSTPGKLAFNFLGACTANPKTEWSECANDKVAVKLTFSFKPGVIASTGSGATTGSGDGTGTGSGSGN